jgi:exopolysaccharide biosynthesis polyprenyl glycosylphosphotransferase
MIGRPMRTLILGTSPLALDILAAMRRRARGRYDVVGVVSEGRTGDARYFPCPVLGLLEDLPLILDEVRPERIVVAMGEQRGRLPMRQLMQAWARRGTVVEDAEDVYERLTGKIAMDSLTPSRLIFSDDFRPSAVTLAAARVISLLVVAVGLIALAPLLCLIALAVKLDSRGSVLFIQDRVGRGGRPFRFLKFRTMHPVPVSRSEWACDNGDRITRVGRWLRKFRLDELPQLINVLRGDMNLVGPRPHPRTNFEMFALVARNAPECGEQIPYYSLRSMIRPGITGWAQVRYRYANDLDEEMEKMRYDLYYVKHLSVWLDLRILFETVKVVVLGKGAGTSPARASGLDEMSKSTIIWRTHL